MSLFDWVTDRHLAIAVTVMGLGYLGLMVVWGHKG